MSSMRFLPVNRQAILVELADLQQTLVLLGALQAQPIEGVQELVPAARTILVQFAPHIIGAAQLVRRIADCDLSGSVQRSDVLVQIPVRYDGEDLAEVAQILGITAEEVVSRHTGSEWSVAFTGFAPGFAYLSGGDPIFNVPRRATPRTKVPAGAVALAGSFSAVYPQASPGGWQIIGVTDAAMWDLARDLPALLQPGYRVQFVDAATQKVASGDFSDSISDGKVPEIKNDQVQAATSFNGCALRVRATGLLTLFQDMGRHGQAGQGVSASGAMDQAAFKTANRLVGNASQLPVLETVGGGLSLQSVGENVVAVTGADAPISITTADGRRWSAPRHAAIALADGDTLSLAQPVAGARCYVAVRGGYGGARAGQRFDGHPGPCRPARPAQRPVAGGASGSPCRGGRAGPACAGPAGPGRRGGAGCGAGSAHRLVHARGRGLAGRPALAGHAPVQSRGLAPCRRAGTDARRDQRAAQRRYAAGGHPGSRQRPARAVSGRPPLDRRLSRHRLCGTPSSGPCGADSRRCLDSF